MAIDTSNFEQHATTDIGSLHELATRYGMVPVVRFVASKSAWAIYGMTVLADNNGQRQLFKCSAEAGDFLRDRGVEAYLVDARE